MKVESTKLTHAQLEFLKSLQPITDEKQIGEIKSLLNFYFRRRLDSSIIKMESELKLSSTIYEEWLSASK